MHFHVPKIVGWIREVSAQEIAETLKGLPADQLAKIKESTTVWSFLPWICGKTPTLENERLEPQKVSFLIVTQLKRENHFPKDPDPSRDFS